MVDIVLADIGDSQLGLVAVIVLQGDGVAHLPALALADFLGDYHGVLVKGDLLAVGAVAELEVLAQGVHVLGHKDHQAVRGPALIGDDIHLLLHNSQGARLCGSCPPKRLAGPGPPGRWGPAGPK